MKNFSTEALDALEAGTAVVGGAVSIACDPPVNVFSGYGKITIGGVDYDGIGNHGLAQGTSHVLGSAAQNITLTLSGVDPDTLPLLDADELRGAPVVMYRLISDSSGQTLLGAYVFDRGRLDQLPTEDTVGGTATIKAMIESAARGLRRRGGRMRSDADQRLVKPSDGGMRHVSYAAEKTLYWGGQPPANAGSALGSSVPGDGARLSQREAMS